MLFVLQLDYSCVFAGSFFLFVKRGRAKDERDSNVFFILFDPEAVVYRFGHRRGD